MTSGNAATVFVDADNTLWDTDGVFAAAQLGLLGDVEQGVGRVAGGDRLDFIRALDQGLAERHHKGLRYPPRLLVQAAALALGGLPQRKAVQAALMGGAWAIPEQTAAEIEQRFFGSISRTPRVRPGIVPGLDALREQGCLVLILTEGALRRVRQTTEDLGLAGHFNRIIEGPKQARLYRRVLRLTGAPERAFMIGDQLDRDIAPAKQAGLTTIYFPGGFQPRWLPREDQVHPDYRVDSFEEVPGIVLRHAAETGAFTP